MVTLEIVKTLFKVFLMGLFLWFLGFMMYGLYPTFTVILGLIVAAGCSYEGWLWYKRRQGKEIGTSN